MFLAPGNGPRSSRTTERPARASVSAAADPAGPAPTTMTSKSGIAVQLTSVGVGISAGAGGGGGGQAETGRELGEDGAGVGHDGDIGELHHRAVRVGVDRDDVVRLAEAARVLDGPADAEGEVER